ncbi:DUF4349 domain-containing protein [Nocardioides sp. SYSU D00038]|uniref:DUF4349 domain-containing protein n=1 Tax=Nocardioides sp. SYSU D00038 TaxID=2812554 RepID=UPI0019679335|nr:DUF4349 domain-containing protein [Nocardioides sp. SYSU D00038]
MTRTLTRALGALAATAVIGTLGAACSPASDDDSAGNSSGGAVSEPAPAEAAADTDTAAVADDAGAPGRQAPAMEQKLIAKGSVGLRSKDVAQARFDTQAVADDLGGEVEESSTETDTEGTVERARLVLRIPTEQFDEAMAALEEVGTLVSSGGSTKDVTTEVLDTEVRVEVQRRSIRRIQALLERAESIRDIVDIEAQLSRRQADLAALERQAAYLADQTSMSTITVNIQRTREKGEPRAEDDDTGFLAGLAGGWDALSATGTGLATVAGALLPWLVVGGVLAVPGVPLLRRLRRRPAAPVGP